MANHASLNGVIVKNVLTCQQPDGHNAKACRLANGSATDQYRLLYRCTVATNKACGLPFGMGFTAFCLVAELMHVCLC